MWNLRYSPPLSLPYGYYGKLLEYTEYTLADHAVPGLTPRQQPRGPLVLPGKYTAELRVGDHALRQPLTVELDPRVHASQADLAEQLELAQQITRGMKSSYEAYYQVAGLRKIFAERKDALSHSNSKKAKDALAAFEKKIDAIDKGTRSAPGFGPVNRDLTRLIFSVESADMRPANSAWSGSTTKLRCTRQGPRELAAVKRKGSWPRSTPSSPPINLRRLRPSLESAAQAANHSKTRFNEQQKSRGTFPGLVDPKI